MTPQTITERLHAKADAKEKSAMKPEQQRILIAEACGWTDFEWPTEKAGLLAGFAPGYGCPQPVPDYLNDLNAMHEAEKCLSQNQYWLYADVKLKETVWKNGSPGTAYQCATSSTRAEAFLRTLGKWKDTESN